MRVRVLMALAMMAVVPALLIVAAGPASAHVLKTVGPYHLLIGFGNEPTYAGAQNSVFLLLTSAKTGAPIVDEGLGDTLKVEVRFGTQHKRLTLVSSFDPDSGQGTKGAYNAYFVPSDPGVRRRAASIRLTWNEIAAGGIAGYRSRACLGRRSGFARGSARLAGTVVSGGGRVAVARAARDAALFHRATRARPVHALPAGFLWPDCSRGRHARRGARRRAGAAGHAADSHRWCVHRELAHGFEGGWARHWRLLRLPNRNPGLLRLGWDGGPGQGPPVARPPPRPGRGGRAGVAGLGACAASCP